VSLTISLAESIRIRTAGTRRMQTLTTPLTPSPPPNVVRAGATSGVAGPLALRVVVVSILLPDEVGFSVEGLRLSAARVVLLVLTPVLLMRFARMLAAGRYRFVLSDLLVLLTGVWIIVAVANVNGVQAALNHTGPVALEFCIGYMAARFLLSEHGEAVSFINFLCWAIAVVALLGLADTMTHRFFLHSLMQGLFGIIIVPSEGADERLGLLRATSTLEHPIVFGITCAIGLLLAASVPIRKRLFVVLACSLGTVLSLSAGPLQAVAMGLGLLTYKRMSAGIRYRWAGLIVLAAAGIVLAFNLSNDPLGFIFSHLTFDPSSGWFRLLIWQAGSAAVAQSPWFGVGWEIPEIYEIFWSVDSVWLLWALTYGIPGSLLLALSIIGAASLPTSGPRVSLTTAESKLGTTLGILIFLVIFLGFTVDFFGSAWILIPVLAGIRAHLGELGRVSAQGYV
jgi:O-antigen ligase